MAYSTIGSVPSANNFKPTALEPISSFVEKSTTRLVTVAKTMATAGNIAHAHVCKVPVVGDIDSIPATIMSGCEYQTNYDSNNNSPAAEILASLSTAIGKKNREMHKMTRGLHIAFACSIIYTT
jgi:hypothetical protein